jgi:hypothetical protein
MQTLLQHASPLVSPVRVDVRLCGGIPRKDMKDHQLVKESGARCSLKVLASHSVTSLNIACLAANGPTSDCSTSGSTHRTIGVCDATSGLVHNNISLLQSTENMFTPLSPLMEAPSWAVPARGESRLEVSLFFMFHYSHWYHALFHQSLTFFYLFYLTARLRFSRKTVRS